MTNSPCCWFSRLLVPGPVTQVLTPICFSVQSHFTSKLTFVGWERAVASVSREAARHYCLSGSSRIIQSLLPCLSGLHNTHALLLSTSFLDFHPKCWTLPSASTATLLSAGGALPARGPVSVSGLQVQSPPGLTCPSPASRSSCSRRKDVEFIGFLAEQLLGRGGLVLRMLNYIKFLVVRGKNLIFTFSFHLQKYVISSNSLSQMAFIWLMNYRVLFSYKNTLERFESLKLWWKPHVLLSKWGEWSGTFSPSFPQTAGRRVFNKFFLQCLWLISSLVT